MIKSSIIIPTAGRPIAIKTAIKSLLDISPEQHDAEIIVIDNNTSGELSADLQAYCSTLTGKIRYFREPSPGLSAARHRGAAEARGELLTFLDDDVEVSDTWLPAIQKGFANPQIAIIGGPSIPKFTGSIPAWLWCYIGPTPYGGWMCAWLSLMDIGQDVPNINPNLIWGLNLSIRKHVLEACDGFHPDLVPTMFQRWQGDGETGLTMKVQAAGYRADYLQNAWLLHLCGPDRLNTEYFKRRAYYQGVCDSFSQIRALQAPSFGKLQCCKLSVDLWLKGLALKMLRKLQGVTSFQNRQSYAVKTITDQAYRNGWLFHQREVLGDPGLLNWVRRKNFFDTDILKESKNER